MPRSIQTVPVRMTVNVYKVAPRRPDPEEEPVVTVQGMIDLDPSTREEVAPLWFHAKVKIFRDQTLEIQSFRPMYGVVDKKLGESLTSMYRHAFSRAIVNNIRLLGVR